jgi:hypothetical protein
MIDQAEILLSDQAEMPSGLWVKVKGWVVGLTSVLVVIPALINAGLDIYNATLDVPKTGSERINAELFQQYFNKEPVVTMPVPIATNRGTTTMKLSVYQAGDIYVEYGDSTRWFPFPVQKQAAFSLVSTAYAQSSSPKQGAGAYSQIERIEGNKIVRERYYANGVKETILLNRNTGTIENKTSSQIGKQPPDVAKGREVKVLRLPPIDVRH